jgi:hypothetical protein
MGIRESPDVPSFEGLDETKTTKIPKEIISNDNVIALQCVFF